MKAWMTSTLFLLCILTCGCNLFFFPDSSGIETSPSESNQVLQPSQPIFIRFPFSADRSSAESLLQVLWNAAAISGDMRWEGRTLYFHPVPDLQPGRRYVLQFKGNLKDSRGRDYPVDILIPFFYGTSTAGPASVLSISPAGGSTVAPTESIVLTFSEAMERASFDRGFSLSPEEEHQVEWSGGDTTVTVLPGTEWRNLTTYTVNLSTEVRSAAGIPLAADFQSSFRVDTSLAAPSVESTCAARRDWTAGFPVTSLELNDLEYRDVIRIRFSQAMNPQKTASAVGFSPRLAGAVHWLSDAELVYIPEEGFDIDTTYTLRVSTLAEDQYSLRPASEFLQSFSPQVHALRLLRIEGKETDPDFPLLENQYTSNVPARIEVGASSGQYTFRFQFSHPFVSTEERVRAYERIRISALFPPGSSFPVPITFSWDLSGTWLTITYSGFSSSGSGVDRYYLLELPGDTSGLRTEAGGYLPRPIEQLLKTQ